jgi:hypothetical protein
MYCRLLNTGGKLFGFWNKKTTPQNSSATKRAFTQLF